MSSAKKEKEKRNQQFLSDQFKVQRISAIPAASFHSGYKDGEEEEAKREKWHSELSYPQHAC